MHTTDIYRKLVAAKIFIDNNFQDRINLELVSKEVFLSQFHFHRLFRQVYKRTPHQYITYRRVNKAKDLLEENRSVSDVCSEVGFESLSSFSTLFKKHFGYAPQYYRNMAWKKKQEQIAQPKKAIPGCFVISFKC